MTPIALLGLAFLNGGVWGYVALCYITLFVLLMDKIAVWTQPDADGASELAAKRLSVLLGLLHFPLLALGIWAIAIASHLAGGPALAAGIALGLFFGQVSNSNAHELIHQRARWPRRLGVAVYISLLFGHHASAHPLVHHVFVASPKDPNSARPGEGFYRYYPRAWIGSFIAGLRAESNRRRRNAKRAGLHPYVFYVGGALLALTLAGALTGIEGMLVYLALASYAQMQLLLSDYVQHYGLRRGPRADGRLEPVGPQHSWNAPHWYSAAMMLNAPLHSDHHANPGRAFPNLRLDRQTMPMLPQPLPIMAAIALIPPLWRRVMDRRAARWRQIAEVQAAA